MTEPIIEDLYIPLCAAEDPNASAEVLEHLSKRNDYNVRYLVAIHLNTSITTLEYLANDEMGFIRAAVAKHLTTSVKTLIELANVPIGYIRDTVVQNPNCPESVRLWIKSDGFAGISLAEFITGIQET